jgi:hypothetical protein
MSNQLGPEVWIRFDVVYQKEEPKGMAKLMSKIYPKMKGKMARYTPNKMVDQWLWCISANVKPVLLLIGDESLDKQDIPPIISTRYRYKTLAKAVSAVRVSPRAIEIIVANAHEVAECTQLYDGDPKRYGAKQWILRDR